MFTAVPALRNNFVRLGIPIAALGPATIECIPEAQRAAWGTYYDQRPAVCAVRVRDAHARVHGGR